MEINYDKEIAETIDGIFQILSSMNEVSFGDAIEKVAEKLKGMQYDFSNPDTFNIMFMHPLNQVLEQLVDKLMKEHPSQGIEDTFRPKFVYMNYTMLSSNIEKLVATRTHTTACSADISGHIIGQYLRYTLTGIIPEFDENEHFWLPKFGTYKEWFELCDGLYELSFGKMDRFISAYATLLSETICPMRRYRHTLNKLIGCHKDGYELLVKWSYDREPEPPESMNGYYRIPKSAFAQVDDNYCDHLYENCDDGITGQFEYKVPQKDIISFKIVSEEKLM